ncbi:MAG: hypothetical protein GKR92_05150 [Gammaproteobacteria bacterium]|nr:MAG: hypothetical protein GKR92_05150 [Gammaproteobacteria bacterium]
MSLLFLLSPRRVFTKAKTRIGKANWEFWIGNFFVVFSTVLGVYLAAHAALETAIQFEAVRADRDSYYVRTSLHNELENNIDVYEEIIKNYRNGKSGYSKNSQWQNHPEYFVWESLKSSPALLTTPPEILAGVSNFYKYSGLVIEKLSKRGPTNDTVYIANKFDEKIIEFKEKTLLLLENNLDSLREELITQKIELQ